MQYLQFLYSIPLVIIVDITVNLLFEKHPIFKITETDLKMYFQYATLGMHFMFGGEF